MIPNQPGLLVELSRLLKMSQSELVTIIVPYVIGWICTYRKMHDLEVGGGGAHILEVVCMCGHVGGGGQGHWVRQGLGSQDGV